MKSKLSIIGALSLLGVAAQTSTATAGFEPMFDFPNRTVLGRMADGTVRSYVGNGNGGWLPGTGSQVGHGWEVFDLIVDVGAFRSNSNADVVARKPDGTLWLVQGNGSGGFIGNSEPIGTSWNMFDAIVGPGDFDGDGNSDIIARRGNNGTLWLYRGDGEGGFIPGVKHIGTHWGMFDMLIPCGDFDGDRRPDLMGRKPDGTLWLYRGNGKGGWIGKTGRVIGTGWNAFDAIVRGDLFDADDARDLLARTPDGKLWLYSGNGKGGWIRNHGVEVGNGWQAFNAITSFGLSRHIKFPDPVPTPPPPPPTNGTIGAEAYFDTVSPCHEIKLSFTLNDSRTQEATGFISNMPVSGSTVRRCGFKTTWFGVPLGTHKFCALYQGVAHCERHNVVAGANDSNDLTNPND